VKRFQIALKVIEKTTEHFSDLVILITSEDPSNTYKVKPNLYNTVDSSMIKALSYVNEIVLRFQL